jgi:hypothetical protein
VLELGHVLFGGGLLRERPRQHELGLEHGAGFLDQPVQRGGHVWDRPMDRVALDVGDPVAGVEFVPAAVEVLGDETKLDNQDGREVEGGRFTALFAPQVMECLFVLSHYSPRIGPADEVSSINLWDISVCRSPHSSLLC